MRHRLRGGGVRELAHNVERPPPPRALPRISLAYPVELRSRQQRGGAGAGVVVVGRGPGDRGSG